MKARTKMQGYTTFDPSTIQRYLTGPDSRSTIGRFARGNATQAGMNQYTQNGVAPPQMINPDSIQRRLAMLQQGKVR